MTIDTTPTLTKAIKIANLLFFGYKVTYGGKHIPASPATIRNGIKYMSLNDGGRRIWDDPNMLPAHKYQNIPQVDISTYERDYCTDGGTQCGPISLGINAITIGYVYSANKENHIVRIQFIDEDLRPDPLYLRFMQISHLDRLITFLNSHPDEEIESENTLLIFRGDSITNALVSGVPIYDITIEKIYNRFICRHPIYVPYRQGWSQLLNISEYKKYMDHEEYVIRGKNAFGRDVDYLHLLDVSGITTWDGESMKIESHGVDAEDMQINSVEYFDSSGDPESMNQKMRRLVGTHEQIQDVSISLEERSGMKHYVLYTIKGINVNGFEFSMP